MKRYIPLLAVLVALAAIGAGCHGKTVLNNDNRVSKEGLLSMWATWYKDKGDKYDIQFNVQNDSGKPIVIMLGDMQCFRGETQGRLRHTFFNTGERTIDFKAGEQKSFRLVCDYGSKNKGDLRILVRRVFDNPSGDGIQTEKVLGQNIEWKTALNAQ